MLLFSPRCGLVALSLLGWVKACHAPPPVSSVPLLRRQLPAAQVLADLTFLQHLKQAAHAGSTKYRSRAQLDSAFAAARGHVTGPLTILQVYRLVVGLTDFEGSLHNDTALPDSVQHALRAEATFFPYPLKLIAGQLVVNTRHAPLPLGATITSINGVPAAQLVHALGKYYTTDGFNTTGKRVGLAQSFPEYLRWEYGPQASFVVGYRPLAAHATRQLRVPAVPYAVYAHAFAARHSRPHDRGFFEDLPPKYTFQVVPQRAAALLTLNTFDIGEDGSPGHRQYARFLDSCFTLLRRSPAITNLLVDVRSNGGGDDDNDMLTFSYLTERPFRENKGATMRFSRVPYRQYLTVDHDTAERAALVAEIEQEAHIAFVRGADGQLHENAHGNPVFLPKPTHFRGQLYLLISPRVASAGSMFAAMVRGNTSAVVIGEETMGGYYGHTGHGSLSYTLPYSGIAVSFSWVDLVQDVPVRPGQPPGRGVLPDYPVSQSLADFVANRDPQVAFAWQLISASPREAN
jgi:hypothetical protein